MTMIGLPDFEAGNEQRVTDSHPSPRTNLPERTAEHVKLEEHVFSSLDQNFGCTRHYFLRSYRIRLQTKADTARVRHYEPAS
jgi:hypothetical protein